VSAHTVLPVADGSQVPAARRWAQAAAETIGLDETDAHRAGLVVTELATNLMKHTPHGGAILLRVTPPPEAEVEVIAVDSGPGMADVAQSLLDGHSTAGSPGTGLGAVRRLSDDFDVYSQPGRGTVVFARVRPGRAPAPARRFVCSGVSVALGGETVCGDAWTVLHDRGRLIAIVVDGLGHGEGAAAAASAAMQAVSANTFDTSLDALRAMHEGLRPTRGAAGSVIGVDPGLGTVTAAGIGNVAAVVAGHGTQRHTVSSGGILGHEVRQFREFQYPWAPDSLLVVHSDGLSTHWSLDGYPGLRQRHPAVVAAVLYRDFQRGRDDVTVVVGREA